MKTSDTLITKHHLFATWVNMRQRCYNQNNPAYTEYGGRGIMVCDEWGSFRNFVNDVGERPSILHSIDRIDNDGHYEPSNIRWATKAEQASNRRNRRISLKPTKRNKTGVAGVAIVRSGKYGVRLRHSWLGTYDTLEEAKNARNKELKKEKRIIK